MDRETRNRIQRATQAARELLEREYSGQLEGVFDIRLDGTIAAEPGEHLDAALRVLRTKLVTAVEHQRSIGLTGSEAVAAYLREAAFTSLNRFVALKMLEARELVQECISRGDQSAGFKEFTGLAPGLNQLPDAGYRLYIECLFDEISLEVRVLFDRRHPASLLWPRRQALQELLGILNAPDLASVWIEGETIGWVYQYFNGEDERKKMREESQAPRNSRELAVRNQFFTPRYVVQFLVENTLGRTWFEMMQGETSLSELDYLDPCQHEVFLEDGQEVLGPPERVNFGETAKDPSPVPFRARKDPRDLKVLDPACGSGHFLLYAFDLLLTIYEEAWQDEGAAPNEQSGTTLRADYPEFEALRSAAPELILRHNLYGIDIDPRAAQIAALALWLRAQRAFQEAGLSRTQRPAITKTNIVVGEPMPGEADLREAFIAGLEPKLGQLVERVFDRMSLAGEAGYLLRIAELIEESIRQVYGEAGDLYRKEDESRWAEAAKNLRTALEDFASSAAADQAFTRQLFAGDAARGLGFIDVCSQRYDTILMNPPFGAATRHVRELIARSYPSAKPDILAAFVQRAKEMSQGGCIGAITNRTCLFITSLSSWRDEVLLDSYGVTALVDLGLGVLDAALVEAACYVLSSRAGGLALSLLDHVDKGLALKEAISSGAKWHRLDRERLQRLSNSSIAYWAPPEVVDAVTNSTSCSDMGLLPRVGLQTSNDFRFLRLQWEVNGRDIKPDGWVPFAKGGEYSPYADNLHLCVNWFNSAREQKAFALQHGERTGSARGNDASRDFEYYYKPGFTYSERTTSDISVRVLPEGCITGTSGPGIFFEILPHPAYALGYFCSATFRQLLELSIGSGDAVESGSAARHYTVGSVGRAPCPRFSERSIRILETATTECVHATRELLAASPNAAGPVASYPIWRWHGSSIDAISEQESARRFSLWKRILDASARVEAVVPSSFAEAHVVRQFVESNSGVHPCGRANGELDPEAVGELLAMEEEALVNHVSWRLGHSRSVSKKTWYADRRVELASAYFGAHPNSVIKAALEAGVRLYPAEEAAEDLVEQALMYCLGDRTSRVVEKGWKADRLSMFDGAWAKCGRICSYQDAELILVDDVGHTQDCIAHIEGFLEAHGGGDGHLRNEASELLPVGDLRQYVRTRLFPRHIARFSRSRRKAPVCWQLSSPAGSYSAWLYYHRFTRDTLFRLLNDHVAPKLQHEERKFTSLTQDAGLIPTASQRKEIGAQETFVDELRAFRDEVARVAPLWNPNFNDGAILNFAPLWRLVPQHKAWQNECKATWDKLRKGDFDWAHLAIHLWPERVVPKCADDRSLAIAHGLEEEFWTQDSGGKWQMRKVDEATVNRLVAERTSRAVKDALKNLLEAPAPSTGRGGARRASAPGRASAPKRRLRESVMPDAAVAIGGDTVDRVREAIAGAADGVSRADVIDATGITSSQWNTAIKALLADGSVTQTGERRGARYHLAGSDA